MSCEDCEKAQKEPGVAYYRWKVANIAMKACKKHLLEIFAVLTQYQRENE